MDEQVQVPGDDRAKRKPTPPREPMEGGSQSRPNVADDVDACASVGLFPLLLLTGAALVLPASAGVPVAAAAIRFYRRLLSRFTPSCPSSPSCSAYALDAVQRLGARRGLAAAAARVRACT